MAPDTAACAFGDPACPCQDGHVCHYVDDPLSETLAMTPPTTAALIAACDRICGVTSNYHKDRCPLYKANCAAMDAMNGATFNRCVRCGKGKVPDSRDVCMFCRLEDAR